MVEHKRLIWIIMYVLTQRAAHLVVCDMVLDQSGQDGTNKRPDGPPRAANGESSRVPAVGTEYSGVLFLQLIDSHW